jgi:hypothetical protein
MIRERTLSYRPMHRPTVEHTQESAEPCQFSPPEAVVYLNELDLTPCPASSHAAAGRVGCAVGRCDADRKSHPACSGWSPGHPLSSSHLEPQGRVLGQGPHQLVRWLGTSRFRHPPSEILNPILHPLRKSGRILLHRSNLSLSASFKHTGTGRQARAIPRRSLLDSCPMSPRPRFSLMMILALMADPRAGRGEDTRPNDRPGTDRHG